jgi:hypothetical protein
MYLIDANFILEIILRQQKAPKCKLFLQENLGLLFISDFALHTIGVILFRNAKEDDFQAFVAEGLSTLIHKFGDVFFDRITGQTGYCKILSIAGAVCSLPRSRPAGSCVK